MAAVSMLHYPGSLGAWEKTHISWAPFISLSQSNPQINTALLPATEEEQLSHAVERTIRRFTALSVSLCLSSYLSLYLSVYILSIYLSIDLSIYLSVCLCDNKSFPSFCGQYSMSIGSVIPYG